jgi:uncharacterized membrane protein YccC
VVIIMEVATIEGHSRAAEIHIAEQRVLQVLAGCLIALGLAWVLAAVRNRSNPRAVP